MAQPTVEEKDLPGLSQHGYSTFWLADSISRQQRVERILEERPRNG